MKITATINGQEFEEFTGDESQLDAFIAVRLSLLKSSDGYCALEIGDKFRVELTQDRHENLFMELNDYKASEHFAEFVDIPSVKQIIGQLLSSDKARDVMRTFYSNIS